MADSGTLHGRNSRFYIGLATGQASPIKKTASNGTAVSKYEIQTGVDFQEDTGQGDKSKTYVPGLQDFSGSLDLFMQDSTTAHVQYDLVRGAAAGSLFKFYAYPGLGVGLVAVYHYGFIYLSLKSLPGDVSALVMNSYDLKAGGDISFMAP